MVFVVDSSPKKRSRASYREELRGVGSGGMWEWDNRRVGEWVKRENGGSSSGEAGYMDDFGMILG